MPDIPPTMKALIRTKPGEPDVLQLQSDYPTPRPKDNHILIQVRCCGLNRAELRSRAGDPPAHGEFTSDELFSETPPKILGEECVGVVAHNGGVSSFSEGDTVATYFCGIGKAFDGAYAEYTLAPAEYVYKLDTKLPFEVLGAIPATFMTAWGSLNRALHIKRGDTVFVHGGTSSVGTAAIILAKREGCHVAATTRQQQKVEQLKKTGADVVLVDGGETSLSEQLKQHDTFKNGAQHVLELVGPDKIAEAFTVTAPYGTVCVTGVLTKVWSLKNFAPADGIESGKKITTYQSPRDRDHDGIGKALRGIIKAVEDGEIKVDDFVGKQLAGFEGIVEGHRLMEENRVKGKVVVTIP